MSTSSMIHALRRRALPLLLILPLAAAAHEGHHHDEDPAPAPVAKPAQVEVVAQRDGGDVLIYVDDYASNAPLSGLQVVIHQSAGVVQAATAGEGLYRVPADLVDAAARELQIEI